MRHLRPILIFFSLSMLLGCQPKHPVEMRISAESSSELAAWRDKNLRRMPEDLQAEFKYAVVVMDPPAGLMSEEDVKKAWARINHATVREFIISAYELSHRRLSSMVGRDQSAIGLADQVRTSPLSRYDEVKVRGAATKLAGEVSGLKAQLKELEARKAKFIQRYPETR